MTLSAFHPAVAGWFSRAFPDGPTAAQVAAWPAIAAGRNALVAAPTGSGKTLTAFMAAIDALVRQGLQSQGLPDETVVVYISPLKALSNDIRLNLEAPLAGIREELASLGLPDVNIRTAVRTGDTPQRERALSRRNPPHILVTTPESLYVLLGSQSGREMLTTVRTVIVDEIHAVAASKRGSHLSLSLERLEALAAPAQGERLLRIGLSATQKPIDEIARFLVGAAAVDGGTPDAQLLDAGVPDGAAAAGRARCEIVDIGYTRERDLALVVPPSPLSAVMSNDQWEQVYQQVAELVVAHRTTLVFVNTRRMAERAARHLAELLGHEAVAAHHGSLAREARLAAEQRLKRGELRVLVATASLELGLDIGDVDLVCQLGSPRSIAAFLQRAGRSGHAVGGTPKARLFAQTRDELVECAALLDCVRRGELDALRIRAAPLDVLAQQIIAEVACRECGEDELFTLARRAWPYAKLSRESFDSIVRMLSDGFASRHGTRAGLLHRDAVNRRLRPRKGARLTALTSGGTIPDTADYTVVLEPQAQTVGTVNEDFAVESLAGDVFQLGNASYRIIRVEPGRVRVEDAHGAAPSIPFWLGEAPGRSDELSQGVARLREEVLHKLEKGGAPAASAWLAETLGLAPAAVAQLVDYLGRAAAAFGTLPTQERIVFERFFDESGGTQLVIHTPFGSRINRAWGLALRKRFCRKFNVELQAAATEDAIVLSLSTGHSFVLAEVAQYLHSSSALDVLVQALLDAPLFAARWRWNATTALALPRFRGGRKVAPQLQRMRAEDLLASIFPDQVACAENISGDREIPPHPLVAQTLDDCLHEAMDASGWLQLLQGLESGRIAVCACDLTAPSPLAAEAINARPYAFLDDAPLEERRTQAVQNRRYMEPQSGDDLGRLDVDAIDAVAIEAWPQPRNADEMHEALGSMGAMTEAEAKAETQAETQAEARAEAEAEAKPEPPADPRAEAGHADQDQPRTPAWLQWLQELAREGRATCLAVNDDDGAAGPAGARSRQRMLRLWVTTERLPQLQAVYPTAVAETAVAVPPEYAVEQWTREAAIRELARARLSALGPVTAARLAAPLGLARRDVDLALLALQQEGFVLSGSFTPPAGEPGADEEWCERHLLARIHRYTLRRLRREIEPVAARDFMRFLFDWQHLGRDSRMSGPDALAAVLAQLEGYEAPAAAWEAELLPSRLTDYSMSWLDDLCTAGRTIWTRLRPPAGAGDGTASAAGTSLKAAPLLLLPRRNLAGWVRLAPAVDPQQGDVSARGRRVLAFLADHGASFFDELADGTHLLRTELEDALGELVSQGRVHCDSFAGVRSLLVPASRRSLPTARRRRGMPISGIQDAGRWALVKRAGPFAADPQAPPAAPPATASAASAAPTAEDSAARAAAVEHAARILLRRYGVVSWRLLDREAPWLPPWRELVRVFQRLEARGEIRGGRFIAGLSGEQFALPEAIAALRQVRRRAGAQQWTCVAATDPCNLVGSLLPGVKVPRITGSRILFLDGVPVGTLTAGRVEWLQALTAAEESEAKNLLLRGPTHLQAAPGTARRAPIRPGLGRT